MRVVIKIVMFFIPVFVILGLIRFWLRGFSGDFVPSVATFDAWFSSFPNIAGDWAEAVKLFNADTSQCVVSADNPFFGAVQHIWCDSFGGFNQWWSAFSSCVSVIVATPFKVLGWLFSIFLI